MTLQQRLQLAAECPGVPFQPAHFRTNPHGHPVNHALRQLHTVLAIEAALKYHPGHPSHITDIGGNPTLTAHHPFAPHIWTTNPTIDSEDLFRPVDRNSCACKAPQTCQDCQNPLAFLSIHSIYYMTPFEVFELAYQAPVIAVLHDFPGKQGTFCEMVWNRTGDKVTMSEPKGTNCYTHLAPDWIFTTCTYEYNGDRLVWKITPLQHAYMVTFLRVDASIPVSFTPMRSVIDTDNPPPTGFERLDGSYVDVCGFLRWRDHPPVHAATLSELTAAFVGLDYNQKNIAAAFRHATGALNRNKIPHNQWNLPTLVSCAWINAGAITNSLQDHLHSTRVDVNSASSILQGQSSLLPNRFRRLLNRFTNRPLLYALVAAVCAGYLFFTRPRPLGFSTATLFQRLKSYLAAVERWFDTKIRKTSWNLMKVADVKNLFFRTEVPPGPSPHTLEPSICSGFHEPPPQTDDATVVILPQQHVCVAKTGNMQYGIGFTQWRPSVQRSCIHNEYNAIVKRITAATPTPHPDRFPLMITTGVHREHFVPHTIEWLESLEGPQRRHYMTGPENADWVDKTFRTKMFVKVENAVQSRGPAPIPECKPRAIQSSTPEINYLLGPLYSTKTKLMEAESLTTGNRVFTYTMPPAEIARYVQAFYTEGCIIASMDLSKADGSVQPHHYDLEHQELSHLGVTDLESFIFRRSTEIRGRSHHGVIYTCPKGLGSGRPYTTAMHTATMTRIWDATIGSDERVKMLHKSDDHLLFYTPEAAPLVREFYRAVAAHGYKTTHTVTQHLPSAEFLSLRFHDFEGNHHAIPKIGRTLSKLGFSPRPITISDPDAHAKAVCAGLRHLNNVPILGAVLEQTAALTQYAKVIELPPDAYAHHFDEDIPRGTAVSDYALLYDTTSAEIQDLEYQIYDITELPYNLESRLMNVVIPRDLGMAPIPTRFGVDNGPPTAETVPGQQLCPESAVLTQDDLAYAREMGVTLPNKYYVAGVPITPSLVWSQLHFRPLLAYLPFFVFEESIHLYIRSPFISHAMVAALEVFLERYVHNVPIATTVYPKITVHFLFAILRSRVSHNTALITHAAWNWFTITGFSSLVLLHRLWALGFRLDISDSAMRAIRSLYNPTIAERCNPLHAPSTVAVIKRIASNLFHAHSPSTHVHSALSIFLQSAKTAGIRMLKEHPSFSAFPILSFLYRFHTGTLDPTLASNLSKFFSRLSAGLPAGGQGPPLQKLLSYLVHKSNQSCHAAKSTFSTLSLPTSRFLVKVALFSSTLWILSTIPTLRHLASLTSRVLAAFLRWCNIPRLSRSLLASLQAIGTSICATFLALPTSALSTVDLAASTSQLALWSTPAPSPRSPPASPPSPPPPAHPGTQAPPSTSPLASSSQILMPVVLTDFSLKDTKCKTQVLSSIRMDLSPPTSDQARLSAHTELSQQTSRAFLTTSSPLPSSLRRPLPTSRIPEHGQPLMEFTQSPPSTTSPVPSSSLCQEVSSLSTISLTPPMESSPTATSLLTVPEPMLIQWTSQDASSQDSATKPPSPSPSATTSNASQAPATPTSWYSRAQALHMIRLPSNCTPEPSSTSQVQSLSTKTLWASGSEHSWTASPKSPLLSDPSSLTPLGLSLGQPSVASPASSAPIKPPPSSPVKARTPPPPKALSPPPRPQVLPIQSPRITAPGAPAQSRYRPKQLPPQSSPLPKSSSAPAAPAPAGQYAQYIDADLHPVCATPDDSALDALLGGPVNPADDAAAAHYHYLRYRSDPINNFRPLPLNVIRTQLNALCQNNPSSSSTSLPAPSVASPPASNHDQKRNRLSRRERAKYQRKKR